jgi:DNA-binding protein YbaB
MFDKLKDMYNLRKQAQEMQKQMATEQVTGYSKDRTFSIVLNGNQELIKVDISPEINLTHPEIEKNIKEAYQDAQEQLKAVLVKKFTSNLTGLEQ